MTSSAMLLVFFYSLRTGDFFVQNDELEKAGPHFCNPMRVTFFLAILRAFQNCTPLTDKLHTIFHDYTLC